MSPTFKVKFHITIFDIVIICELSIFLPVTLNALEEKSLIGKRDEVSRKPRHTATKVRYNFPTI